LVGGGDSKDYSVSEEIEKLIKFCEDLSGGVGGTFTFKQIFYAPGSGGAFESLVGTMIAAKKQVRSSLLHLFIASK